MLFPRLGGGSQVFLMQVFVPFDMPERVETPSGVRSSEGGLRNESMGRQLTLCYRRGRLREAAA